MNKLTINLDDPKLVDNKDLYIQLISKHLAMERYYCYHKVQKFIRNKRRKTIIPMLDSRDNSFSSSLIQSQK